jgi:hypothetical protein
MSTADATTITHNLDQELRTRLLPRHDQHQPALGAAQRDIEETLASGLSGKVFASHDMMITLSSPFAL